MEHILFLWHKINLTESLDYVKTETNGFNK